jgi:L-alanine-DL-glutamate epimerase-like enolase superfamily enzyme
MSLQTEARVVAARLFFLPIQTRVPLKFGTETLTRVTCARVRVEVENRAGHRAVGWGETPLSVQWVWPSGLPYAFRERRLREFCRRVIEAWVREGRWGHPLEVGWDFHERLLGGLLDAGNREPDAGKEPMPRLAALLCCSVIDQAVHDAYGRLLDRPVYTTYGRDLLGPDLAAFLEPAEDSSVDFAGRWPADFLELEPARQLPAWHLVGGLDAVTSGELTGQEPDDGYPLVLEDWIRRDGLKCLKIKLRGHDEDWDYARLVQVGEVGRRFGVSWLSADFNCTVTHPDYVNRILDRVRDDHPALWPMLLYVEQPFPYDLEEHPIRVDTIVRRKALFLDESAHDWRLVRLGRKLGWNGVALKTCKTQTGAILSARWAKAHGMQLMVQDLTNPMLAQIPHVLLAAHVGTIMGVETNAMQFYPEASRPEAAVHPGLYARRDGMLDLGSIRGPGFGYRVEEIQRELPTPAWESDR